MKKVKLLIVLLFVVSVSSCKKEGCTNSQALNYSSEAKKDDGSCILQSDVQNQVESNDAQVYSYTLNFNSVDSYQQYTGVASDFDDGDVVITFVEDPNESGLDGFWVQMPYISDDYVNFYAEITDNGNIFLNTVDADGFSPWISTNYFNFRSVLIKGTWLQENPSVKFDSYQEVKEVFNL